MRHKIFLLVFLAISIPILRPLGIPLTITKDVRSVYDFVENLPKGSAVVISFDVTPAGYGENGPGTNAMMKHILSRGLKIVGVSFCDTGPMIQENAMRLIDMKDKKYGEDWVNLGFRAGEESSLSAFAADIHKTFPKDFRGNDISSLPMMKDIKTIKDAKLIIDVFSSVPGVQPWIRQVSDPYKIPMTSTCTANNIANLAPFVQSKQLIGLVPGLRGGAEYELLIKQPAVAVAGMDAQSCAHVLVLGLVIVGNIIYFRSPKQNGGAAK